MPEMDDEEYAKASRPWRNALKATANRVSHFGEGRWQPADGATAQAEWDDDRWIDETGWGPLRQAHSSALTQIAAALSQLEGVARVLEPPPVVHCMEPLARSASESAARAAWLLDVTIDTETRARRGMAEQIFTLRQMRRLSSGDLDESIWETLARSAEELGIELKCAKKDRLPSGVVGVERPSPADAVVELFGGEEGALDGYVLLSGPTHGDSGLLGTSYRRESSGEASSAYLTLFDIAAVVGPTLVGVIYAVERMVVLYGWDLRSWESWGRSVARKVFPPELQRYLAPEE